MKYQLLLILIWCNTIPYIKPARILCVFPTPSISHQVVFRPLTQELVKRGHEVVIITTDPAFDVGQKPENLTEIDVHTISYSIWNRMIAPEDGESRDWLEQMGVIYESLASIFIMQAKTKEVQLLLSQKESYFDLLILEAPVRLTLGFSYAFKAPVIIFSSLGQAIDNYDVVGAPSHPLLYPALIRDKLYNLTLWEKIEQLKKEIQYKIFLENLQKIENNALKTIFGNDIPPLVELYNNVDMLFINVHPIWENNRPVPPNVVFLGGLHLKREKALPKDLQSYLDWTKNGFIYFSFGSNVKPSMVPPEKLQVILNVFSRLEYDVLVKWDDEDLPVRAKNIKVSKWLPQSDILRHPKVKLFITQGGILSTDEAITAGVPLIGMPIFGDQFFNTKKYELHGIGIHLDIITLTEDSFENAIKTIINNQSYAQNIAKLRGVMYDEPQKPLDRAVWWTEYVLRHGGARHLRSPSANVTWSKYLELNLLFTTVMYLLLFFVILFIITKTIRIYIASRRLSLVRNKILKL